MSLGEVQQLYRTLQEIDQLLSHIQVKTESFRTQLTHGTGELREFEYLFYRLSSLMERLGLPPNIKQAIDVAQRLILTLRVLHSAMLFLERGTPLGYAFGLISLVSMVVNYTGSNG